MEKENRSPAQDMDELSSHPLENAAGNRSATPPALQLLSSPNNTLEATAPVQRQIKIGEDETYTSENFVDFLMKYGMGPFSEAISKYQKEINLMLAEGDHQFDSIVALIESLQPDETVEDESELDILGMLESLEVPKTELEVSSKPKTKTISKIGGFLGEIKGLDTGITLNVETSKRQSSKTLLETQVGGLPFMLKAETEGKSEFEGLKMQAAHGVRVPLAASVVTEDGRHYLLMSYEKHLSEGLGSANRIPPTQLAVFAEGLGKVHIADIRMCNVDRLPWRGNGNTGHLFNVFFHGLTCEAIGLDSEMVMKQTEEMRLSQTEELTEIETDTMGYATKMYNLLSAKKDRNKLMLKEEQIIAFKTGFAKGLAAGLKV